MSNSERKTPNRDVVTSINRDGSRFVIHPADVKGSFTGWRRIVGYALILLFIALPWISINGYPSLFLDVAGRRFHLFGLTLAFQDTWMLFFLVSGLAFSLFYITALWGRVWCGWACPQTVYLEHVYRRIERWIDGDATARRKLDKAPWTPLKVARRVLKHTLFVICSFAITHIFLAYFVSIPGLWDMMTDAPARHWSSFLFVFFATAVLYVNFAWFREQLCIVICPYGRFQSALIDNHSLNVAYDYQRGDPPGKPSDPQAGDCIDCHRCVQVCPTGIDIRQGLQLECIGCAACIDACDQIMEKVDRPKGLIRYASDEELEGRKTRFVRARTILYTLLLFIGAGIATTAFSRLEPASASVIRMKGAPYYITDDSVRNQFQIRLLNKSEEPMTFRVSSQATTEVPVGISGFDQGVTVHPLGEKLATLVAVVKREDYQGPFEMEIRVRADGEDFEIPHKVEFLGPDPKLLNR